jgi:hypothetical protein
MGNVRKILVGKLKENKLLGKLGTDGSIILQEVLERTNHLLPFHYILSICYEMSSHRKHRI